MRQHHTAPIPVGPDQSLRTGDCPLNKSLLEYGNVSRQIPSIIPVTIPENTWISRFITLQQIIAVPVDGLGQAVPEGDDRFVVDQGLGQADIRNVKSEGVSQL